MSATEEQTDSQSLIKSGTVHTLDIPYGSVHTKQGFAIDFGSSVLKIAYAQPVEDKVCLHFVSFPRERIAEAYQFVKDKVGDCLKPGKEVCLTGIGTNQHKDELEKTLCIRMKTLLETDCFVDGFIFLTKNVAARDLYHRPSDHVLKYTKAFTKSAFQMDKIFSSMPGSKIISNPGLSLVDITEEDMFPEVIEYPLVLIMCGSAGVVLLVNADGRYEGNDVQPTCGRTLLGIGSMLTGAKSFEELVQLAEKGDASKIDVSNNAIVTADDDTYSNMLSEVDIPCFSWGHAVGKDIGDFRKEDRAAAVVTLISRNLAVWSQLNAAQLKAKRVYFCGGIHANSDLIRDEIHKDFATRASLQRDGIKTKAHFVKLGAYLGSLGCLLANLKAPTEQDPPVTDVEEQQSTYL